MDSVYALSHGLESILFLAAALFLYYWLEKREYDIRITRLTMYVLGLLAAFFAGIYVATGIFSQPVTGALVPVIHLFIFASIAYMWKFISVWNFPQYEKYHRVFWALGVIGVLSGIGIYAGFVPSVVGQILPMTLIPFGLVIGAMGYYSAYMTGGADGMKIALFTTGAVDALLVSALLNNLYLAGVIGSPYPAIINNLVYGVLFVLAVFWGYLKGVKW